MKRLACGALVLLFFTIIVIVMTYPQARYIRNGVSDLGDPLLSTWRMCWIAHQLPRDPIHLFDANMFYPARRTLAYSDPMIVPGLMAAPLIWMGVPQLLTYNLLFLSGFILSGATMFWLVKWLTNNTGAALLSGLVFAVHPYRFEHYSHLELQMTLWMPLGLLALHRIMTRDRTRDGLLLGLFVALQTLSSLYYGVFFASYLAVVGTVLWIRESKQFVTFAMATDIPARYRRVVLVLQIFAFFYLVLAVFVSVFGGLTFEVAGFPVRARDPHRLVSIALVLLALALIPRLRYNLAAGLRTNRKRIGSLLAGAVLAAVIIFPVTLPYFANRGVVGERSRGEAHYFSAEPRDYLVAHERNALYYDLTGRQGKPERQLFQGTLLMVLAVVGLWPPLSTVRAAYALGLLFAFQASLGFNGFIYPSLYSFVLPFRGLRVPARFSILVGMTLAILAGYGVAKLTSMLRRRWAQRAVVGILAILVLFEYRSTLGFYEIPTKPPPVYAWFQNHAPTVLIEFPISWEDSVPIETTYMYFSTFHWQKLVNGYSGFLPPHYIMTMEFLRSFPDDFSVAHLKQLGVEYAIVHNTLYDGRYNERYDERYVYSLVVERLAQRHDVTFVGIFRSGDHVSRLYRLPR